jgi:histidyl-tRNA synthetase
VGVFIFHDFGYCTLLRARYHQRGIITANGAAMPNGFTAYQVRQIENTLIDFLAQQQYDLIDIPIIDTADLFLTRAGDTIIDSLFTFERRSQQWALRPEFTATAARRYIQQQQQGAARWQFVGSVFADDDSSIANYQQHSYGAELIGAAGSSAEAEIIALAVQAVERIGLTNWQLVIGHVGLQSHLLARYGLDSRTTRLLLAQREALKDPARGIAYALEQVQQVMAVPASIENMSSDASPQDAQSMLDVLLDSTQYGTTMGGRSREDIVRRLLQKRQRALAHDRIIEAVHFLHEWVNIRAPLPEALQQIETFLPQDDTPGRQLLADWRKTLDLLQQRGIPAGRIILQPNLARNWEYYTHVVFGIQSADLTYVVGGGRYDELIRLLGGQQTPAVGFAVYMDRLLRALAQHG